MCCRRTLILICLLLAFCTSSFCRDTILRIGVTILQAGPKTVSGTEGRDRLVKELNQHKRNKKLNATIEAVPLENQWGVKAAAEAEQKRCQFVISTHLTDARTSSALTYNGAGSDMDYMPVFSATVEYRLIRLSDGAPFDIGSTKDDDPSSLQFATWAALSHIAHQAIVELEKGGNVPHPEKIQPARAAVPASSAVPEVFTVNNEPCAWLPEGIPHAAAIHNVCEYAHSLTEKMPNFICDQDASRYQGNNKVSFDLITALVRYEDGRESYENIKHNGQPAPEALTQTPGLWSTGQFGSDLRSIFDPWNHALFTFAREDKKGDRPIWVFTYRILKQNDPLWRLHGNDEVLAPPYNGELWIDQKTGNLLRFTSVATDIPSSFAIRPQRSKSIIPMLNSATVRLRSSFRLHCHDRLPKRRLHAQRRALRQLPQIPRPHADRTQSAVSNHRRRLGRQRQSGEFRSFRRKRARRAALRRLARAGHPRGQGSS